MKGIRIPVGWLGGSAQKFNNVEEMRWKAAWSKRVEVETLRLRRWPF
jgi:hypothetical protein